jgi:putative transposase
MKEIRKQAGISERTLRRYLASYREDGFGGLKPKEKGPNSLSAISADVLEQAILLRREVPTRSVSQIIQILEWEQRIKSGEIKRSTLQEHLSAAGYSTWQMRIYRETGVAARRFVKPCRNMLWHSDIKYGPYIQKQQMYLVVIIDDATRFVLHAEFYPTLDQVIVEDAFRKAVMKYGTPECVYFDNGKQYRTKWMTRTCGKMGIRLLYAKPYSPESKGKVEWFNRSVDAFLAEISLSKPNSLEQLNKQFWVWLEECYQHKPHSALPDNQCPCMAFQSDSKPLRYLEPEVIADAFLHCEKRKVDKAGCISFNGTKYEAGLSLIGCTVEIIYHPADFSELTVEYEGYPPLRVKPLVIGEYAGQRPKLPETLTEQPVDCSRLLNAAEKANMERRQNRSVAVSYRGKAAEGRV